MSLGSYLINPQPLTTVPRVTTYNSLTTAGESFGVIVAAPAVSTGNTGAKTNYINFTPPSATGVYEIIGLVNMTAWTTPATFTVVSTYQDDQGNARTDTATVSRGSTGATAAAVTAIDRWYFDFPAISIDNSGTAITLSTTGTFTGSPSYSIAAILRRNI